MPAPVWLPRFDPAHEQSRILRWLVAEGEAVLAGDPVCEVETDKVNMELEAPASGLMGLQRYPEGAIVPVVTAIAWVLTGDEQGQDLPAWPQGGSHDREVPVAEAAMAPQLMPDGSTAAVTARESTAGRRVRATPAARHLARVRRIDLAELRGSGPRGRIQARDLKQAQDGSGDAALPVYLEIVVDMSASVDLQRMWPTGASGLSPGVLVAGACARALVGHPALNARKRAVRHGPQDGVHLVVELASGDGQSTRVLRDVDRLSLQSIQADWSDGRQEGGNGREDDAVSATDCFRIVDGSDRGPERVVTPPFAEAVAGLGVGRLVRRIVPDETGRPVTRPTVTLTLTVAGGPGAPTVKQGVRFLEDLGSMLENPLRLLLQGGRNAHRDRQ